MNDDSSNSKKAPIGRPFPPRVSGNRKGRPKGSRNEADLLNDLFNTKISEKGRKQRTTVIRAIIQQQFTKAMQGEKAASKLISDFSDKLGLADDVTSEERKKRTLNLPRAFTRDEYDLKIAPARDKERQYYTAVLDRENPTGRQVAAGLLAGDEHMQEGRYEDALRAYTDELASAKQELAQKSDNEAAKRNRQRARARIGLLADHLLEQGDFAGAENCVEMALSEDEMALSENNASNLTWIRLIGAHADMFLGNDDAARSFYLHFNSNRRYAITHWESIILQDFAKLRKLGGSVRLMMDVEGRLMEAGWRTSVEHVHTQTSQITLTPEESEFVQLNPRDLNTADILIKYKKFDEAAEIYRFLLDKHRSELTQQAPKNGAREMIDLLEIRHGILAREFLFAGHFGRAFECVNELPRGRLSLEATRAHALMLDKKNTAEATAEAKDIYLRYGGQTIEGRSWQNFILDDFRQLSRKGHSSPLMGTLEAQFERNPALVPAQLPALPLDQVTKPEPAPRSVEQAPDLSKGGDINTANWLLEQGCLEEALTVYRNRMEFLKPRFANGVATGQERIDRQAVVDGLSGIAFALLFKNDFKAALGLVDEALSIISNAYWANLRRAHVLMVTGHAKEARPIYKTHLTGKASPERTKAAVIREEFDKIRAANLAHELMDEIEKLLPSASSLSRIIR